MKHIFISIFLFSSLTIFCQDFGRIYIGKSQKPAERYLNKQIKRGQKKGNYTASTKSIVGDTLVYSEIVHSGILDLLRWRVLAMEKPFSRLASLNFSPNMPDFDCKICLTNRKNGNSPHSNPSTATSLLLLQVQQHILGHGIQVEFGFPAPVYSCK